MCSLFYQDHYLQGSRPYILDGIESPESAALRYEAAGYYEGGLLARADSPSRFPPMSAYGKQPSQLHGFDSSRPFPEPSFYTVPPYTSQPPGTANPAAYYNAPQMTSLGYGSRPTQYDNQGGAYLNVGSTAIPEVLSYQPGSGAEGTRFEVNISALYEMSTTLPMCSVMFSTRKCQATVMKTQQQGAVSQYLVTAEVPPYRTTGWSSSTVPVYLLVENGEGDLLGKVDVGSFTYGQGTSQPDSGQRVSHDPKLSGEPAAIKENPSMRPVNDGLAKVEIPQYGYSTPDNVAQSPYSQQTNSYGGMMTQYSRQPQYQSHTTQRPMYYPNTSTASSPSIKERSPLVTGWTPYPSASSRSSAASRIGRSPGRKTGSMSRPSLNAMPSPMASNPPLIRTSTLQQTQQTPSPAHTPAGNSHAGHAYPYSPYAPKASLKVMGNLESMAHDWSYEEWDTKRRLVLFERIQNGSEITTTFKAVSEGERPRNSICISCIFWPEKQEMFVTSVDIMSLLEKLVNARFTVEEKNRIRRNLEGFRPLTVSKGKADTEEMFKIIMLFPDPKPRNIEKDIKVFSWKILSNALNKIIGKYSASPSSTLPPAPSILTPVSQTGYTTDGTSAMAHIKGDHIGLVSPRSISRSVSGTSASTAYAAAGASRTISPPVNNRPSLHGVPPDIRLSVPSYNANVGNQWHGSNQHMSNYNSSHLGDQNGRGPWDLTSYLQNGPSNPTPGTSHSQSQLHHPSIPGSQLSVNNPASDGETKQRTTPQSQQMPPS